MEQTLLSYDLANETVTAIIVLYRSMKVKVRLPDRDMDFFDIVVGVLFGDKLEPDLFLICLDYVVRTPIDLTKETGFILKTIRSRRYPAETITQAYYTDDLALLANAPAQDESQ